MNEPKVYKLVDYYGMIYHLMPSPRKVRGTRGHNPKNAYAEFRSPMREARRQVSPISGRQWVKFRKFGSKAYKAFKAKSMEGIIDA